MSTNIYFVAEREVIVKCTGNTEIQKQYIGVWQTPTSDTYKIMNSPDPKMAYVEWVLSEFDEDEEEPIYAEGVTFCEGEPIGFTKFNSGKEHAAKFLRTCEELEAEGWEIRAEAW